MFQTLVLFVAVSLSVAVESITGNVLSTHVPELSQAPPQDLGTNSTYEVNSEKKFDEVNGGVSNPVDQNIPQPELVRNVECYIHSSTEASCSWQLASHAPDLRFFFELKNAFNYSEVTPLQECPSYIYTDGKRTGCNLQIRRNQEIRMVFNGTLNMPVRNNFEKGFIPVRAPPLNWTVIKYSDIFNISWTPPDVDKLNSWWFIINYTECDEKKSISVKEKTSIQLNRLSHCQYHMTIMGNGSFGDAETQWSDTKSFDADIDVLIFAALLVPVVFAILAVLIFVWCRKNKENIFPKVPEPRDLLSDISDNNNKSTVLYHLYIPAGEDEDCKITLVTDPQLSKPHS